MDKETILPIENTGYFVSNLGKIYNRGMKLCPYSLDRYGYRQTYVPGKKKVPIHRLVALVFLPKPKGIYQVNHKDGNKQNNNVNNLEWVTPRRNIIHSYENRLNRNSHPVILRDIGESGLKRFISVKSLCKYLGVRPSVIIPYMRLSQQYPIMGKYVVELIENQLVDNTVNFGKAVYVLSSIGGVVKYPSVPIASYHTSLRGLTNISRRDPLIYRDLGYVISFSKEKLLNVSVGIPTKEILLNREKYYSKPYRPNSKEYKVYDYFNKTEHIFDTQEKVLDFINSSLGDTIPRVTKREIQSMYEYNLCRGYGIKYGWDESPWKCQFEYVLLCNRYKRFITMVYRVKGELIFGKSELAEKLNLPVKLKEKELLLYDSSIERLDSVIYPA